MTSTVLVETAFLKCMLEREVFNEYQNVVPKKRLLKETQILLEDYKKYFDLYPDHQSLNLSQFYTHFATEWRAGYDELKLDYYRDHVFPAILAVEALDVSEVKNSLLRLQYQDELKKLLETGLDPLKLETLAAKYKTMVDSKVADAEAYTVSSVDFNTLDKANGVPWFLAKLQDNLGSLVAGQFVVVAGDVGTGKSAFCISQAVTSFLHANKTGGRSVVYFNSEGTAADVFGRFLSCLYRKKIVGGFEEVITRHAEVVEKFKTTFDHNKFIVFQMSSIKNVEHLREKVLQHNPSMVLIDICDKLAYEEDPQSLKKLYDNLRLLSAEVCPIIGTSQSNNTEYMDQETGESRNRKWLGDKALHGSRQGKSGAADTIITIGKEDTESKLRYLAVPKKKRGEQTKVVCELEEKFSYYKELKE